MRSARPCRGMEASRSCGRPGSCSRCINGRAVGTATAPCISSSLQRFPPRTRQRRCGQQVGSLSMSRIFWQHGTKSCAVHAVRGQMRCAACAHTQWPSSCPSTPQACTAVDVLLRGACRSKSCCYCMPASHYAPAAAAAGRRGSRRPAGTQLGTDQQGESLLQTSTCCTYSLGQLDCVSQRPNHESPALPLLYTKFCHVPSNHLSLGSLAHTFFALFVLCRWHFISRGWHWSSPPACTT